ncbi:MAG: HPF/RaiA family ribosome-associated protein, partial [Planctomycetota bacterium]
MQTQVNILHRDYPSRFRGLVDDKLHSLQKFYDRVVSMRASLERLNEEHRVEIVANVGRGAVLVVDARGEAFGGALDEAMDRMSTLLKKYNEKLTDGRRRAGRS